MTKLEFERRAREMRARNAAARSRQELPPSIASTVAAPTRPLIRQKIQIKEHLSGTDLSNFDPALKAISKTRTLETDRDGLVDFGEAGVQITVSPELIARGVVLYSAVLKAATTREWIIKAGTSPGSRLRVAIGGEQLDSSFRRRLRRFLVLSRPQERVVHVDRPESCN